jgi:hypothetical protein
MRTSPKSEIQNPKPIRIPKSETPARSTDPMRNSRFAICSLNFPGLAALLAWVGGLNLDAQTATWTEITHPSSPAFAHHDMTYDSLRHRLIAAGRTFIMAQPFAIHAGAADGSWTQLPAPSPALPGYQDIELAYDSHRDVVVLYTTATNKVWEFDGTNWTVITATTTPIQCADGAQMQYDPLRRKTVLVGTTGYPGVSKMSETWFWDGTDWTLAAGTNASPRGAAGGGMAFDAARGEMVLLTMGTMQTWTFNGTNWTERSPATVPSPGLWVFDLAYDPVSQRVVFFGGETRVSPPTYPTNTWAWDGTNWMKIEAATGPPGVIDYALAGFPERGGLVMHGGWGPSNWNFRTNVWLLTLDSAPACLPPPPGLVGWWPGNGDATDWAGANHGTPAGDVAFPPGQVGAAFAITGSGRVRFDSKFPFHEPGDATVAFWLKAPPPGGHECVLWTRLDTADANRFNINLNPGGWFAFDYRSPGGVLHLGLGVLIPLDTWVHLVLTRTGNSYAVHTNGVFAASLAESTPDLPNAVGWQISGREPWLFQGGIDELTFFNRALSGEEIAALYAAGRAGMCPQPPLRFIDIRPLGGQFSLTSIGRAPPGASQVLQASTNLALTNAWANVQTNPAPTGTNTWLVPRQGDLRFFRLWETD